jgi:hypothetical protein
VRLPKANAASADRYGIALRVSRAAKPAFLQAMGG